MIKAKKLDEKLKRIARISMAVIIAGIVAWCIIFMLLIGIDKEIDRREIINSYRDLNAVSLIQI